MEIAARGRNECFSMGHAKHTFQFYAHRLQLPNKTPKMFHRETFWANNMFHFETSGAVVKLRAGDIPER